MKNRRFHIIFQRVNKPMIHITTSYFVLQEEKQWLVQIEHEAHPAFGILHQYPYIPYIPLLSNTFFVFHCVPLHPLF